MARRTAEEAAKTREQILDQALRVFAEQGIAASQLEEIARRAGVTRGALYHHFSGKEELLFEVLKERWDSAMSPVVEPLRGGEGREALEAFVDRFLRRADEDVTVRALLKVSLSGELTAWTGGQGLAEKARVWSEWLELLDRHIGAARGSRRGVRTASEAVLHHLVGYAVWSSLFGPPPQPDYRERRRVILEGVLR